MNPAQAGAVVVVPSDMPDGRVGRVRRLAEVSCSAGGGRAQQRRRLNASDVRPTADSRWLRIVCVQPTPPLSRAAACRAGYLSMPSDPTHATIRHVGRHNDDGARLRRKQSLAREPRQRVSSLRTYRRGPAGPSATSAVHPRSGNTCFEDMLQSRIHASNKAVRSVRLRRTSVLYAWSITGKTESAERPSFSARSAACCARQR